MRNAKYLPLFLLPFAMVAAFLVAASGESREASLLFVQVKAGSGTPDWQFPAESRIVRLEDDGTVRVLTDGFAAARALAASFDGGRILFSGRREGSKDWQIWEMDADGSGIRQVTTGFSGCTDPAYLPDGRIVFSAEVPGREGERALYTADADGGQPSRITYSPEPGFSAVVLRDSRVLYTRANGSGRSFFAVRYDGTGAEELYTSPSGMLPSNPRAYGDGNVVFVEGNSSAPGGRLVTMYEGQSRRSRIDLSGKLPGGFHSASAKSAAGDAFVVAYRRSASEPFGLYDFDARKKVLGAAVATDAGYHAVEPLVTLARNTPLGFVSVIEPNVKTGSFYCLDANDSQDPAAVKGVRVQVLGAKGLIGEAPLEQDGSFHLEISADTPVRFQVLDSTGNVVRGPSAWVWVRPNEQRGCVGCHENREMAPENRVPIAITKPAVSFAPASSEKANDYAELDKH